MRVVEAGQIQLLQGDDGENSSAAVVEKQISVPHNAISPITICRRKKRAAAKDDLIGRTFKRAGKILLCLFLVHYM